MPELCRFYGIVIAMRHKDHNPPHFHALYGGRWYSVEIETLSISGGGLSPRIRRLIVQWASIYQDDLRAAWERAQRYESPGRIAPLE